MACCRNKRRSGISLIVGGSTLVILGLIISQILPNLLKIGIRNKTCINSKDNANYEEWINSPPRKTLLYYWNIVNKENFLYNGETPKLEQKGPYIYTTKSKKIDVVFDNAGKVTYKTFNKQEFDAVMTREKCPSCVENDKLSVLNSAYLGIMAKAGSDLNFCFGVTPSVVTKLLTGMDAALVTGRNATLKQLGKLNSSMFPANTSTFPQGWSKPEFGAWIGSHSSYATILQARSNKDFNSTEMAGLYNVLLDGVKLSVGLNVSHITSCRADPIQTTQCGLLIYLKTYATVRQNIAKLPLSTPPAQRVAMETIAKVIMGRLQKLLCPEVSACFDITTTWLAVLEYVSKHLVKFVTWSLLDSNEYGLVTTRTQNDFALGYTMNKLRIPPQFPNGIFVKGLLTHHRNEADARARQKSTTFYTCLSTSGRKFTVAAIDGESTTKRSYFPNAQPSDLKIEGYIGNIFPAVTKLKTCESTYSLPDRSFDLFISPIHIKTNISHTKDITHHGLKLQRYEFTRQMVAINNVTVFSKGLVDLSSVHGFPILASFPNFLHGEPSLSRTLGLAPDIEIHGSFMDVEPISGLTMRSRVRLQLNAAVLPEFVSAPRQRPLNVSYVSDGRPYNTVVPLYWIESGGEINETSARQFSKQVFGTLRTSCGLNVGMPVCGGLGIVAGIVLLIIAKKTNQTDSVPPYPEG